MLRDLIRIPSENPPGKEDEIAEFVAEIMKKVGLNVELDEVLPKRPNVYGTLKAERTFATLVFNSHMDTVPVGNIEEWGIDPFGGDVVRGRIYGRGSCDAKGSLCAMIMATKLLNDLDFDLNGNVVVTAVIDEEVGQRGTLRLVEKGIKGNFAIVGEPTSLDIGIAHKGNAYYEITVTGKSAHASIPDKGVNAIYKMAKIVNEIEKLHKRLKSKKHNLLGSPSISIGTIVGGTATNVVPEKCTITVDRRYMPWESGETAKKELEQIIEKLKKEDPTIKVEIKKVVDAEALKTSEEEPFVKCLKEAGKMVMKRNIRSLGFPYATDSWILANKLGIPTVIFGPGNIEQAHRPNEFIEIDELINATKIYTLTAVGLLSTSNFWTNGEIHVY